MHPSGQLAGQGLEHLGGKKSAYLAVQSSPAKTKILVLRVSGLRGSMRSNARTGDRPALGLNLLKAIRYFFANFFFFLPKRQVQIEILDQTEELRVLAQQDLTTFNQALEEIYNYSGEENLVYLPHYFYYNDIQHKTLPSRIRNSVSELQNTRHYDKSQFLPEIINAVFSEIKRIKNLDSDFELFLDQNLVLDLYLDSLDMAELKNSILAHYPQSSNTPILELKTIADLVAMAQGLMPSLQTDLKPCQWSAPLPNQKWLLDPSKNILEHFKLQWQQDKSAPQLYDSIFGMQTRNDIVIKAILISDYLKKID